MKQNIRVVKDILFQALERLSDNTITGDKLRDEINRSEAIVDVVAQINSTADMVFRAAKALHEIDPKNKNIGKMLTQSVGVMDDEDMPSDNIKQIKATIVNAERE